MGTFRILASLVEQACPRPAHHLGLAGAHQCAADPRHQRVRGRRDHGNASAWKPAELTLPNQGGLDGLRTFDTVWWASVLGLGDPHRPSGWRCGCSWRRPRLAPSAVANPTPACYPTDGGSSVVSGGGGGGDGGGLHDRVRITLLRKATRNSRTISVGMTR